MTQSKAELQPLVWVTRPRGLELPFIQGLERLGFKVHYEPMLVIEALTAVDANHPFTEQLRYLADQDAVIFISVNAVQCFWSLATPEQQQKLHSLDVYAVGKATAACLEQLGIASVCPQQDMSSEGLLMLEPLQEVSQKRFYIMRGCGGRGFLQQQLEARGAIAEHVELYRRLSPSSLSPKAENAISKRRFDGLFAGSIETFENILRLAPALDRNMLIITPSARVRAFISSAGFLRVEEAASASNADMIETLQRTLV